MISPVMKLARSEARNKMGPAISSAVPARLRGIEAVRGLAPPLEVVNGWGLSLAPPPGGAQLTTKLCRPRSRRTPFLKLHYPPPLPPASCGPGGAGLSCCLKRKPTTARACATNFAAPEPIPRDPPVTSPALPASEIIKPPSIDWYQKLKVMASEQARA